VRRECARGQLCPSFYRAEVVQNPKWHERAIESIRGAFLRMLQPA
jgi:indolepyruvate ferredoxin oxidoreductase alpha subunit